MGENLSAYVDGQVSEKERALIESHLTDCPRCAAELSELRCVVDAMRVTPAVRPPRSFLLSAEMAKEKPKRSWFSIWSTLAPAVTGVAALILAALLFVDFRLQPSGDRTAGAAPVFSVAPASPERLEATEVTTQIAYAGPAATPPATPTPAAEAAGADVDAPTMPSNIEESAEAPQQIAAPDEVRAGGGGGPSSQDATAPAAPPPPPAATEPISTPQETEAPLMLQSTDATADVAAEESAAAESVAPELPTVAAAATAVMAPTQAPIEPPPKKLTLEGGETAPESVPDSATEDAIPLTAPPPAAVIAPTTPAGSSTDQGLAAVDPTASPATARSVTDQTPTPLRVAEVITAILLVAAVATWSARLLSRIS